MTEINQPIILKTYRFVFAEEVTEQLSLFSQVHQYDERKVFKEAWQNWIEEDDIKSIINAEVKRITDSGFVGDVLDKMFKSARYYYRKKSNVIKPQQERKVYEGVPQTILMKMDEHINVQIKKHAHKNIGDSTAQPDTDGLADDYIVSKISPASSFENYCTENQCVILQYIKDQNPSIEKVDREFATDTINKLKKTYKNRFYNIRVTYNNNK